jgi:hypothetical protein
VTTAFKIQGALIPRRVFTQPGPTPVIRPGAGLQASELQLCHIIVSSYSAMRLSARLKIGLFRAWDGALPYHVGCMQVLRTHEFGPLVERAPIGDGRRPRHREDPLILDGEPELHHEHRSPSTGLPTDASG